MVQEQEQEGSEVDEHHDANAHKHRKTSAELFRDSYSL
jgi:hypothetical protein